MSTALALTRALIADFERHGGCVPPRDYLLKKLAAIEAAQTSEKPAQPRGRLMGATLLAMADLGPGCTPMQLGHALDPTKDGYRAGALGGNRINALNLAGLVQREHFGWWVLTEAGRAEVARLQAGEVSA